MPSIYAILRTVHETVHSLPMKRFNQPKIYTGGVDIDYWSFLTKNQKKEALNKRWYVYYSYRNPKTNKLVRQNNIHLDVNRLESKSERLKYLQTLRLELKILLKAGFSPYGNNQLIYNSITGTTLKEKPEEQPKVAQIVNPGLQPQVAPIINPGLQLSVVSTVNPVSQTQVAPFVNPVSQLSVVSTVNPGSQTQVAASVSPGF
jgi:hypothetical protein